MKIALFWFRRDLRLDDNAALYHALRSGYEVLPIFIFDTNILDKLANRQDPRLTFIYQTVNNLHQKLGKLNSSLDIRHGDPITIWHQLCYEYDIAEVYTNHDYEPYAQERDKAVGEMLNAKGIAFYTYKDQCIFEKNEVLSNGGTPYTVFTPYSRKWKEKCNDFYLKSYPTEKHFDKLLKINELLKINLPDLGFEMSEQYIAEPNIDLNIIKNYHERRDTPSILGTSRLGVHLRFGTISIRTLARMAKENNETYLNELIWRDFYMQILWHFPHIGQHKAFRKEYDFIEWRNNEAEFERWCKGKTGYPLVDAGMRELNQTGFMHNRVRMVVASFLTKHLLIDWRWGEAYFAEKLMDFDMAANNGGWQWAAGCGTDAAPYFRVFNPTAQQEKFDPALAYIKRWIPEFGTFDYPQPMIEHKAARERCLAVYKKALS